MLNGAAPVASLVRRESVVPSAHQYCYFRFVPRRAVVQQEKAQQNLLQGVHSFDKAALKRTDTKEKVVLPDTEGENEPLGLRFDFPFFFFSFSGENINEKLVYGGSIEKRPVEPPDTSPRRKP